MSEPREHPSEAMLRGWIEATTPMPTRSQQNDWGRFLDWCRFYGLLMPVDGIEVANYLLGLMADGERLRDIRRAARAIIAYYQKHQCFLDHRPIKAALAMAAAQLAPNRTLN